jgi:hypothetical protein
MWEKASLIVVPSDTKNELTLERNPINVSMVAKSQFVLFLFKYITEFTVLKSNASNVE